MSHNSRNKAVGSLLYTSKLTSNIIVFYCVSLPTVGHSSITYTCMHEILINKLLKRIMYPNMI